MVSASRQNCGDMVDVNPKSIPHMIAAGRDRIVNLISMTAEIGPLNSGIHAMTEWD